VHKQSHGKPRRVPVSLFAFLPFSGPSMRGPSRSHVPVLLFADFVICPENFSQHTGSCVCGRGHLAVVILSGVDRRPLMALFWFATGTERTYATEFGDVYQKE
jgi:hypothetical protein